MRKERREYLMAAILLVIISIVLIITGIKMMDEPLCATIEIMCGTLTLVGAERGFTKFSKLSKKNSKFSKTR